MVEGNLRLQQEGGKAIGAALTGRSDIETMKATVGENEFFARWPGHHAEVTSAVQSFSILSVASAMIPGDTGQLADLAVLGVRMRACSRSRAGCGHYPEIATHDELLIRRCLEHLDKGRAPKNAYEFQMLLGVPRSEVQQEIVKRGQIMRIYVPFAEEWKYAVHYLKRRLAANPAMASMVMRNMFRS